MVPRIRRMGSGRGYRGYPCEITVGIIRLDGWRRGDCGCGCGWGKEAACIGMVSTGCGFF